jgi:hypothetical protein
MNKSESIGKLAKALSIVQGSLRPAIKDAKNPFFKSNYADLNSVWDCCRQLLTDNGLSIAQLNQVAENGVVVETVLMHESGEWISGEMFLPLNKQDAQSVGSAVTYGRRYGLAAVVGIVADEDDDANATRPQPRQQPQPVPQQQNVKHMPYTNEANKQAPAQTTQSPGTDWMCGKELQNEIIDLEAALDSNGIKSTSLRDALEKNKGTRNPATLSKEDAASYKDYLKQRNDKAQQKSA